jgi:hypothetical protein
LSTSSLLVVVQVAIQSTDGLVVVAVLGVT